MPSAPITWSTFTAWFSTYEPWILTLALWTCALPLIVFRAGRAPEPPLAARKRIPKGKPPPQVNPPSSRARAAAPAPERAGGQVPTLRYAQRRAVAPAPEIKRTGALVVAAVCLLVAAFLAWRGGQPIGHRPDSWSDANVVVSGRNYAQEGFWKHWLAAQHQVVTPANPSDPFFLYTLYPVASNVINGLWQSAGITSDRAFRAVPALCSVAALAVWYWIFRRVCGPGLSALAVVCMALSWGFLAYADNLHFHAYAHFTSAAAVACFLRAAAGRPAAEPSSNAPARGGPPPAGAERAASGRCSRRNAWLAWCAAWMFVTAWFTWEYHIWMVLLMAGYALLIGAPFRKRWLPLLLVPILVAVSLQTVQRRLAFAEVRVAGPDEPRPDLLSALYRRTIAFEEALDTPRLANGARLTLADYPAYLFGRYFKFYGLPVLGALALLLILVARERPWWRVRQWSGPLKLTLVLLVAGMGWWLVMMQHTSVHPHTMRLGLAGYALLLAAVVHAYWSVLWSRALPIPARVAAGLLPLILIYPAANGVFADINVHTLPRYYDARERGDAGAPEIKRLTGLPALVPPGAVILTDYARLPMMRYWSERPVYNGHLFRYPEEPDGRIVLEMTYSHLRELYSGSLPPLYFAWDRRGAGLQEPEARLLLTGQLDRSRQEAELQKLDQGRSEPYCRVVGQSESLLVFDIQRLIPLLDRLAAGNPPPSLHQYGPPR